MPLAADVNLDDVAARTTGMSPADLRGVCEQSALHAMQTAYADAAPLVTRAVFDAVLGAAPDAIPVVGPPSAEAVDGEAWLDSVLAGDDDTQAA